MSYARHPPFRRTLLAVALLGAAFLSACKKPKKPHELLKPAIEVERIPVIVEERTRLIPTYPCSSCHAGRRPNKTERTLVEYHTTKKIHHGPAPGWCYRCHTPDHIDNLHLSDGTLISFDEAYRLCGSCHGDKLRDWRLFLHGRTDGNWNGQKYRKSCTFCHNPHSPKYKPMVPERPPDVLPPKRVTLEAHLP